MIPLLVILALVVILVMVSLGRSAKDPDREFREFERKYLRNMAERNK
jgi:hypothetical protein